MRRGPAILLLVAFLLAAAYGAQRAVTEGWNRLTGFAPGYFQTARPSTGSPPMANRLVLIMVDGLRVEDAPLLPSLDWLRRQGVGYRLTVPAPGYPTAAAATLLTGALPEHHGVLLELPGTPLQADSLPAAAARARLTVGGMGTPALHALLGPAAGTWQDLAAPEKLAAQAGPLLAATGPRLLLIQIPDLHTGIHKLDTANRDSPEYRKLLAGLDTRLVELLAGVDLKTTAVVVTGTVPTDGDGKHPAGGRIPLIMAGSGVAQGEKGEASLTDVAPTVAALLGIPVPLESSGRPLLAGLKVDGRPADLLVQRSLTTRKAFVDAQLTALGAGQFAPDPPAAAADAPAYIKGLEQMLWQARLAEWKHSVLERLPYVGGAILVLLLYLIIALRQPFGRALLVGVFTYGVVFHLLFFATGGRYSPGMTGLELLDRTVVGGLGMRAAIAMAVTSVTAGYALSRRGFKHRAYMTAASLHMALTVLAAGALPVVIAAGLLGWTFKTGLPPTGLLVWFFVTGLEVVVIGYMSPVWALITVWTCQTCQRVWPLKEVGDPVLNADRGVRARPLRRSHRSQPRRLNPRKT